MHKRKKLWESAYSREEREIVETVRRSQLSVSNDFELKKITRPEEGFLNCTVEEDQEELVFHYDIRHVFPWTEIRREKREMMLSVLIDAGKLQKPAKQYSFTLSPENLYYDIQGRVFVKTRDVYGAEGEYSEEEFLTEYKSLIGCTLLKKYKFEDYYKGGQELLKEDKFLSGIVGCVDAGQIADMLYEEYFRYRKDREARFVEVTKAGNSGRKAALGITGLLLAAGAALLAYQLIWTQPYEEAVIAAYRAYMQSDYNGIIGAMETVEIERMDACQKYILSYACVRCESFGEESMRNILNTIVLNGDEKIMEYWICINRLDTDRAIDIAMQEASSQLLYYAYLKKKAVIEADPSLSGQEKNDLLQEIDGKLEPLREEFSTLTEE